MKKLLFGALALVMLCGCGGGSGNESKDGSTTVCKGSLTGQDVEMTMDFDGDDKLTGLKMTMSVDAGSAEGAEMAKDMLEEQKDALLADFGGAGDATFTVNGTAVDVVLTIDVSKATNVDGVDLSETKDSIIKSLADEGFTCE